MQLFAILGTITNEHAKIVERAKQRYGDANVYMLEENVIIASSGDTTREVAVNLGIGDDQNNYTGVIVQVSYYWGFYNKSLWEWMSARAKSNGN